MDPRALGKPLVAVGALLVLLGVGLSRGWLSWFGRLPGDLRFEGEHTKVFVPVTSMLVVSLALSLVLWLARRLG